MPRRTDARARRAAPRRQLGASAQIVRHRSDGTPVLSIEGHEVIHRIRAGDSYFRLQLLCSVCARSHVTWRGARITSAADLVAAQPEAVTCDACIEDRLMSHADESVVRARFTHRKPTTGL